MSPYRNERDGRLNYIVLGNPENRRVQFFIDAVARVERRCAAVVSWQDFLRDARALTSRLASGAILRIESPGENFEVERALLLLGDDNELEPEFSRMTRQALAALEFERGRILPMRQWYRGWQVALARVEECLREFPGCRVMNSPREIAVMFDKAECHEVLRCRSARVPALLGLPRDFEELREMMAQRGGRRIFLKPCHSSSASGVVAIEMGSRGAQAFSSVEVVVQSGERRLYNSLNVRRYSGGKVVADLVDAICRERCLAEVWLPKAGFDGRRVDLRVLVIAGRAAHVVVRLSTGPMTNLHLGNQRGDVARLRERMGEEQWREAMHTCERAAAAFPESLYVAVDLLVSPSFRRTAVAEVNAFGDLLPKVLHDGRDTYSAELAALHRDGGGATREAQVSTIGR